MKGEVRTSRLGMATLFITRRLAASSSRSLAARSPLILHRNLRSTSPSPSSAFGALQADQRRRREPEYPTQLHASSRLTAHEVLRAGALTPAEAEFLKSWREWTLVPEESRPPTEDVPAHQTLHPVEEFIKGAVTAGVIGGFGGFGIPGIVVAGTIGGFLNVAQLESQGRRWRSGWVSQAAKDQAVKDQKKKKAPLRGMPPAPLTERQLVSIDDLTEPYVALQKQRGCVFESPMHAAQALRLENRELSTSGKIKPLERTFLNSWRVVEVMIPDAEERSTRPMVEIKPDGSPSWRKLQGVRMEKSKQAEAREWRIWRQSLSAAMELKRQSGISSDKQPKTSLATAAYAATAAATAARAKAATTMTKEEQKQQQKELLEMHQQEKKQRQQQLEAQAVEDLPPHYRRYREMHGLGGHTKKKAEGGGDSEDDESSASWTKRWKWIVIGGILRTPVISVTKAVALNMVRAQFLGSHLLGGALVALCALAELDFEHLAADDGTRPDVPLEPTPLPKVQLMNEKYIPIPKRWVHKDEKSGMGVHKVDPGEKIRQAIENGMHHTAHTNCVGRDGSSKVSTCKVTKIERIENLGLWKQYWHRKYELTDAHHADNIKVLPLDPPVTPIERSRGGGTVHVLDEDGLLNSNLNECFLYHGTKREIADIIVAHGFDERLAQLKGLYGAGNYFANQACKAGHYTEKDKYTGEKTMLVVRVTLGDPFYTAGGMQDERRPPEKNSRIFGAGVLYDSVIANTGAAGQVHRELIVYDRRQAYPEYIVTYRES